MTGRPLPVSAAQLAAQLKAITPQLVIVANRIMHPVDKGVVLGIVESNQALLRRFEGKP